MILMAIPNAGGVTRSHHSWMALMGWIQDGYAYIYICMYVCMYVCVRMVSGKLRISETWMMDRMKIPGMSNVIDEVHTDTGFLGINQLVVFDIGPTHLWLWELTNYPLVNIYITMERSTIFYRKTHYFDWAIFNSKLLVYQRVINIYKYDVDITNTQPYNII